jgi:hypothetical protein
MISAFSLAKAAAWHNTDTSLFQKLIAVHSIRCQALGLHYQTANKHSANKQETKRIVKILGTDIYPGISKDIDIDID